MNHRGKTIFLVVALNSSKLVTKRKAPRTLVDIMEMYEYKAKARMIPRSRQVYVTTDGNHRLAWSAVVESAAAVKARTTWTTRCLCAIRSRSFPRVSPRATDLAASTFTEADALTIDVHSP